MLLPIKPIEGDVLLFVRLTPKASRNEIGEVFEDARQQLWLKVYVTAVPESGKANDSLIRLISKKWQVPASKIHIIAGHADRSKTLKIVCSYDELKSLFAEKVNHSS